MVLIKIATKSGVDERTYCAVGLMFTEQLWSLQKELSTQSEWLCAVVRHPGYTLRLKWGEYRELRESAVTEERLMALTKGKTTKKPTAIKRKRSTRKTMSTDQQQAAMADDTPIDTSISLDDPELKQCFEWGISDARVRQKENYESCKDFVDLCLSILDKDPLDEDRLNKVIDCYYQGYLTIVQLGINEEADAK